MRRKHWATTLLLLVTMGVFSLLLHAQSADNKIMGQLDFVAMTKPEKNAGIWIDGLYLGYVKELKGDKKVLLLPGDHEVIARQSGYKEFEEKITLEPGKASMISLTSRSRRSGAIS